MSEQAQAKQFKADSPEYIYGSQNGPGEGEMTAAYGNNAGQYHTVIEPLDKYRDHVARINAQAGFAESRANALRVGAKCVQMPKEFYDQMSPTTYKGRPALKTKNIEDNQVKSVGIRYLDGNKEAFLIEKDGYKLG